MISFCLELLDNSAICIDNGIMVKLRHTMNLYLNKFKLNEY